MLRRPQNTKQYAGCALIIIGFIAGIVGFVGFSIEGEVNDISPPHVPDYSFFSEEPLPSSLSNMFITSNLKMTWTNEDIYVVIVDEQEKSSCPVEEAVMQSLSPAGPCSSKDQDIIAGGAGYNGEEGFSWQVEPGEHYVGLGSKFSGLDSNENVDLHYDVHLRGSFAFYFIVFIFIVSGGVMWWD